MRNSLKHVLLLNSGGGFSPADISGLKLWLDSNDSSTLFQDDAGSTPAVATDPVGLWTDKSGNANDLSQSVAGERPTVIASGQNGLPIVRGDGVDDELARSDALGFSGNQPYTIFLCAQAATNMPGLISFGDAGGAVGEAVGLTTEGGVSWRYNNGNAVFSEGYTTFAIGTWIHPSAGTYADARYFHNGVESTLASSGGGTNTPNYQDEEWRLFSRLGSDGRTAADIGEVIVYNRELTDTEISQVNTHLVAKWGV